MTVVGTDKVTGPVATTEIKKGATREVSMSPPEVAKVGIPAVVATVVVLNTAGKPLPPTVPPDAIPMVTNVPVEVLVMAGGIIPASCGAQQQLRFDIAPTVCLCFFSCLLCYRCNLFMDAHQGQKYFFSFGVNQ